MFACLTLQPNHARAWRKAAPPQLHRVDCPGGAPFFRLEAQQRKHAIDWNAIEQAAGRLRTKMLFPEGVSPPTLPVIDSPARAKLEPGLRAFAPRRLPLLLCLRTAQQVLRASKAPAQGLRVTVVDTKGALCRCLEPLVPLAGSLRVFTPDFAAYRGTAAQLLRRYGATLILSDSPGCFAHSDIVVADSLDLFTGRERGLIFTPDPALLPGCRVVRCRQPELPGACAHLRPEGIDPLLFAGALYELCGVKEMERLRFGHFAFDGNSAAHSLADLSSILDASPSAVRAN